MLCCGIETEIVKRQKWTGSTNVCEKRATQFGDKSHGLVTRDEKRNTRDNFQVLTLENRVTVTPSILKEKQRLLRGVVGSSLR